MAALGVVDRVSAFEPIADNAGVVVAVAIQTILGGPADRGIGARNGPGRQDDNNAEEQPTQWAGHGNLLHGLWAGQMVYWPPPSFNNRSKEELSKGFRLNLVEARSMSLCNGVSGFS
jgi:hypothetical protein